MSFVPVLQGARFVHMVNLDIEGDGVICGGGGNVRMYA
jgi:hypothetical protein